MREVAKIVIFAATQAYLKEKEFEKGFKLMKSDYGMHKRNFKRAGMPFQLFGT